MKLQQHCFKIGCEKLAQIIIHESCPGLCTEHDLQRSIEMALLMAVQCTRGFLGSVIYI